MLSSRFISIAVALMFAAGAAAAQTNAGKEGEKKSDGAVTTAAKATGKATAGGAKRLGLGIKDAVTPGDDSKEKKEK